MSERTDEGLHERVAWTPSEEYLQRSRLKRFMKTQGNATIDEHLAWASADIGRYWGAVVQDLELDWHKPYEQVIDLANGAPWA